MITFGQAAAELLTLLWVTVFDSYRELLYRRYTLLWPKGAVSVGGTEIEAWCREQFGPPGRMRLLRPPRWIEAADAAYILRPDDAFAFKMRWC